MRRKDKLGTDEEGWGILRNAQVVHLATTRDDGTPVIRPLHPVVLDDALWVHGSMKGEKNLAIGRPCVVSAHEVYAEIPSYFLHPERACPATTLYASVMLQGVLQEVTDTDDKVRMLVALMARYQPEGGFVPIDAADKRYTAAVRGVRVLRLRPDRLVCRREQFAGKSPQVRTRVAAHLWQRGARRDVDIAEALWSSPGVAWPTRLSGPHDTRMVVAMTRERAEAAAQLVVQTGHATKASLSDVSEAHRRSAAWVGVLDSDGSMVATARAVSDARRVAVLQDVVVRTDWRGRGVGSAMLACLLDHPAVRRCESVQVTQPRASHLYQRLGVRVLRT